MSETPTSQEATPASGSSTPGTPAATPRTTSNTTPAVSNTVQASNGAVTTTAATTAAAKTPATVALASTPQQVAIVSSVTQPMATLQPPQGTLGPRMAQQIVVSSPQTSQVAVTQATPTGAVIRSSLPQGTVQVIQGHPFVQQQYMQQQYYIQGVQPMQAQPLAQQVNLVQGRGSVATSGHKSPIISGTQTLSNATVTLKTVASSVSTVAATQTAKGGKTTVFPQQTVFGKPILSRPGQPLVIPVGQLAGVISNQGNQTLVAQPKSPSVSLGSQQVINSPTQIRFTTQPTFMTSQGQIVQGNVSPAVLTQLQQVLGSQSAIIGTQPLYLRPAGPLQTQQGIMGNVQAVLPNKGIRQAGDTGSVQMKSTGTQVKTVTPAQVKGVANILPQTARPIGQIAASPTNVKGVQTPQIKQVSRVRALKPQVKAVSVAQVVPGQPAKIAPQVQIPGARILTPTMTRPPTVLVQPKPQPSQKTTATQLVTMTTVTTTPVTATVASAQTSTAVTSAPTTAEVPPMVTVVSPEKKSPATTIPKVSPIKPNPVNPTIPDEPAVKTEEPMDTQPGPVAPAPQTVTITSPGVVGAGAGPDKPLNKDSDTNPPPPPISGPPLGPSLPSRPPGDRSDRVATVIGERQAAIVKPNVLTHIIEGFVIQEAPEPFPVQRCSALSDFMPGRASEQEQDSALEKHFSDSSASSSTDSKATDTPSISKGAEEAVRLKCEVCGKVGLPRQFRPSGRFCSRSCAKRYNVGCSQRLGRFHPRKKGPLRVGTVPRRHKLTMKKIWKRGKGGRVSTGPIQRNPESPGLTSALTLGNVRTHTQSPSGADTDLAMSGLGAEMMSAETTTTTTTSSDSERSTSPSGHDDESSPPRSPPELEPEMELGEMGSCTPHRHLSKWTVQEVVDFVRNLPGCGMYAEDFNRQEIDGQALMLLKEDHLMTAMNIKLGPALKICSRINSLKDEVP